ncbi:hypothetical protein SAMD00019534_110360 [Acytostelium subglobosum LB1]|uniref:hypothetical protein n=1 Tax=Acytostelium subglobosum LB1 TaxID=1410327 RepID=UPI000644F1E1|nr:hypothetical protein SAMD00019534_110360 [Acytostelium subglobosum LB1]GAM27860.1 hypothetical protein SAMD00019534_110360 [Acytostelium subglobosum LB1]|eukprot:XP_012749143.1 hypothetical protein SAMD00019534_110360 [Acytostelium subglobosum LB1]
MMKYIFYALIVVSLLALTNEAKRFKVDVDGDSYEHQSIKHTTIPLPLRQVKLDINEHRRTARAHLTDEQKAFIAERDQFVSGILNSMSLLEKIGQMTQIDINILLEHNTATINQTYLDQVTNQYKIGSFLNSPTANGVINNEIHYMNATNWIEALTIIQNYTLKNSPSKVPMIYGMDSVHGANYIHMGTMFPHANAVSAKDSSAVGFHWIFAPVLGVGVQPLWSRTYETFGEDPYVASIMGAASVTGFQGGQNPFTGRVLTPYVASCMKHYLGYSDPVNGKDRTPAWIPERMLRRYFLPSFAAAVDAGASSAMINSGEVNGVPMHASEKYVNGVLRGELAFDGLIVTDWQDIEKLVEFHHLTSSMAEAIIYALNAGIDMSMVPDDFSFPTILFQLVQDGVVPESRIDESVTRILNLKYAIGLFDEPYPDPSNPYLNTIGQLEDRELAASIVEESITLLQNLNEALPLNPSEIQNILVTGPSADSLPNQCGGWSVHWQGPVNNAEVPYGTTVLGGIQQALNQTSAKVVYEQGTQFGVINQGMIDAAVAAAKQADAVVVVMGEQPEAETPGDIYDLSIDPASLALLEAIVSNVNVPVILVLFEARPRVLPPSLVAKIDGVLMGYLPGPQAGKPIADIIFGDVNPSGRLPITYPATTGDISPYYYKYSLYGFHDPLFDFGTGLSYTSFTYSNLVANLTTDGTNTFNATIGQYVAINVTVTNTGKMSGKDTVLLFLSDLYASVTPEIRMLRGVDKVDLNPGDSINVQFILAPLDFSFIGQDNRPTIEPGQFTIAIGQLSIDINLI